jgi:protocatechuate 3,4-dioxygenase beta subunit
MSHQYLHFTRRRFIRSSVDVAATLQLERAARSLALEQRTDACRLSAQQEIGPYYIAEELLRSDIAENKPGVPLSVRIVLLDSRTCKPLPGAAVDLWHCDALGVYSGFTKQKLMGPGGPGRGPGGDPWEAPPPPPAPGFDPDHLQDGPGGENGPGEDEGGRHAPMGPPPNQAPSDKLTFLRGIQLTGADGSAAFRTVFPGFYMGRTNHIHFKVRVDGHASGKSYEAGHTSYVGQMFFPEEFTAELMQHDPYRRHTIHRTTLAEDRVFGEQHGELSIAHFRPLDPQQTAAGFHAELVTTVDPSATSSGAGFHPRFNPGFAPSQ